MTHRLPVRFVFCLVLGWPLVAAGSRGADALPLFFIPNRGQAPDAARFMVKGSGLTAYFLHGEIELKLAGGSLSLQLQGSDPHPLPEGRRMLSGHVNFLTGSLSEWALDLPLYEAVVYRQVYAGIDMIYGGTGRSLKSEFVVSPGADPSRIHIRYSGGTPRVADDGSLILSVAGRELREEAPVIYQEHRGVRQSVSGRFQLLDDGTVGFELGEYDPAVTLVIDPVLSYSTLLGGSGTDTATSLAVDPTGAAYVAGYTDSYNFPSVNAAQSFTGGGTDAFVAKLNAAGNGLVYCTYLGGSADDRAYGIAVDSQGNAYVAGSTTSRNFPVRAALQSKIAGNRNAFVVKLNTAGNGLVYSTYLGGNASDSANGIAVDASGAVYVAGDTTSYSFPATGFQRGIRGGQDAFVAKLSPDGSQLVYSTYLGGSGEDRAAAIAMDSSGTAYVAGSTFSTDFPVANAAQRNNAGGQDAFVARLSADGNSLMFGTYLGGMSGTVTWPEMASAVAVDRQGNAYVAGVTSSADFPRLNALQTSLRGFSDAFVTKLTAAGALSFSTYLGGAGSDQASGVAVDAIGNAYVTGYSYSADLPVTSPLQAANAGEYDAFVAELNPAGSALLYLSYLGGNGSDAASAIALDGAGSSAFVAGWTLSTNFPLLNTYQALNSGNYGAFVTKIVFSSVPVNFDMSPSSGNGPAQTFTFQFSDPAGASNLTTVGALIGSSPSLSTACAVSYDRVHNALALLTDAGQLPAGSLTPGSGSQQNSRCSLNGSGSSVLIAGQVLTLKVAITFLPAFNGAKNIYMQAANSGAATPWEPKGAWSVTFAVANVSVSPSSGGGTTQTFAFEFSDEAGANDLTSVAVLFNSSPSTVSACSVTYDRARNTLALLTDAGQLPASTITPGSGAQQNAQCVLNGVGSGAVLSGQTLSLSLSLTFLPAFSGTKTIYMQAVSPYSSAP